MKYIIVFILLFSSIFARVINFSPLPMDKAPKLFIQYKPLLNILKKRLVINLSLIILKIMLK